ncbi:MAG: hypothetical protein A2X59_00310 [Nitrospirae bacterium GWC2_42_7]|nr:MAG: hypothetical protein A2X59_00310 [Nitrospirae bacterium GWC2_42_7]
MFRFLKFMFLIAVVCVIIFLLHGLILEKAGKFIYKKDELKPADVIVVLAGEQMERVEYGASLFKEGWARKDRIIMAGGPLVWKYSWAGIMKEHAVALGIPAKQILLEDTSRSTEEDAKFTKDILMKHGYKSMILITSPYHSKRASMIFGRIMGKDIKIINAPADNSWFSFDEWWKRRRDRSVVLSEYSKFIWLLIFGVD